MVLGQVLVAGSMVQGAKLRVWVKPRLARVWSEERNYGLWSNAGGGKCGPGRETAGLGQAQPRPSVVRGEKSWSLGQALVAGSMVQGAKLRVWVKHWWREVWSREPNCDPGSSPSECGPRREIMVLGQALVAGSVVQGAKLRPWVKPVPAKVWSREPNCGPGSPPAPPKYGPGSQTAARVKPDPARVWSRERNCGPGSSPSPPECGLGSQTVPPGHPQPRYGPGSQTAAPGQAPPKYGPGSQTVPPGHPQPRPSVVQGAKLRPWVKPVPAKVWSREPNCGPGSPPAPPKYGPGSQTAAPGHPRPRRSVV